MKKIIIDDNYLLKVRIYNPNCKYNTEGMLFTYKIDDKKMLLKTFYLDYNDIINNKIYTLNCLNKYKGKINLEELVIPEYLIYTKSRFEGIMMDLIPGINLENILYSPKYNIKDKMSLLKKVGILLEKLDKVNNKNKFNLFINDLHEGNIIVTPDNDIKIVDLDSCKICDNIPAHSKYLSSLKRKCINNNKYKVNESAHTINPNKDTDLYCYNIMVLNTLFQGDILRLTIDEFYDYLNYLESINIDKELLSLISKLYTEDSNYNIYEYLDTIDNNGYKAHRNIYKIKK